MWKFRLISQKRNMKLLSLIDFFLIRTWKVYISIFKFAPKLYSLLYTIQMTLQLFDISIYRKYLLIYTSFGHLTAAE